MKNPIALMFYFGLAVGKFIQAFGRSPRYLKLNSKTYDDWGAGQINTPIGANGNQIQIVRDDSILDGEVEAA